MPIKAESPKTRKASVKYAKNILFPLAAESSEGDDERSGIRESQREGDDFHFVLLARGLFPAFHITLIVRCADNFSGFEKILRK